MHKVSILPRGRALGVTHALPERDRLMYRKEYDGIGAGGLRGTRRDQGPLGQHVVPELGARTRVEAVRAAELAGLI